MTMEQFRTERRPSAKFGKMNPINKQDANNAAAMEEKIKINTAPHF